MCAITSLLHATNRSLSFVALDFASHLAIADSFGIQHSEYDDDGVGWDEDESRLPASLVIVDVKGESEYLMLGHEEEAGFSEHVIAEHVLKYSDGDLQCTRTRKFVTESSAKLSSQHANMQITSMVHFEHAVLNSNVDALVFYNAAWCGACMSVSHQVAEVQAILAGHLPIYRVSHEVNALLEWPFYVDNFPAFVFYPANRPADSSAFPASEAEAATAGSIVEFILKHASCDTRRQIMKLLCESSTTTTATTGGDVAANDELVAEGCARFTSEL